MCAWILGRPAEVLFADFHVDGSVCPSPLLSLRPANHWLAHQLMTCASPKRYEIHRNLTFLPMPSVSPSPSALILIASVSDETKLHTAWNRGFLTSTTTTTTTCATTQRLKLQTASSALVLLCWPSQWMLWSASCTRAGVQKRLSKCDFFRRQQEEQTDPLKTQVSNGQIVNVIRTRHHESTCSSMLKETDHQ